VPGAAVSGADSNSHSPHRNNSSILTTIGYSSLTACENRDIPAALLNVSVFPIIKAARQDHAQRYRYSKRFRRAGPEAEASEERKNRRQGSRDG